MPQPTKLITKSLQWNLQGHLLYRVPGLHQAACPSAKVYSSMPSSKHAYKHTHTHTHTHNTTHTQTYTKTHTYVAAPQHKCAVWHWSPWQNEWLSHLGQIHNILATSPLTKPKSQWPIYSLIHQEHHTSFRFVSLACQQNKLRVPQPTWMLDMGKTSISRYTCIWTETCMPIMHAA